MLYIYRRGASDGARELVDTLSINSRKLDDLRKAHFNQGIRDGDRVVCWGGGVEGREIPEGVEVLNNRPLTTKFQDALLLKAAGIPTVEVSEQGGGGEEVADPFIPLKEEVREALQEFLAGEWLRGPVMRDALKEIEAHLKKLGAVNATPLPPPTTWIGRRFHHIGGNDLLTPTRHPDYFSKKEDLVAEYRIHAFLGKSIRAGKKAPREGVPQHPWVRSFDGGWRILYDGFTSPEPMRKLALKAVKALKLDFGAVDIGEKRDHSLLILEVNRAPGLEGGSVTAYTKAIEAWVKGEGA